MTEKMSENNINLIFAVTSYMVPLYKVNKTALLVPKPEFILAFDNTKTHIAVTSVLPGVQSAHPGHNSGNTVR